MLTGSCHCGAVTWTYAGEPDGATACNCTVCRRYGVLWIYGHEGEGVAFAGPTRAYVRGRDLEFHFCPTCACVIAWRSIHPQADGRRRCAVNARLSDPDAIANIPIDHFDGFDTFEDKGRDGRCVKDYWF